MEEAKAEHTTELASMQALLDTATAEHDAATTAKMDAETAKGVLETERDTADSG